ncbi:MAG: hypothetical protein CO184_00350 [Candidatus Zambryskibacteria bacterium CG_4_9_14_3_um_filter_40_16]|uniref:ComEC/Rec2-related protein domain-containing protein n=2 Tax=Candidatus Zambryskiibacteriota TaxID=1817925 RepID=A0A2H0K8T5_9BACT|nr:MAG: hypothetical protein COV95_02390 [Candidatus Zambryskibacteria bacterium CG11_big_fil_rev_8_21_14_0_20_40_24]PJA34253.1 MAG: hypothetical protein CO184_00350 [Candidatus Zambryskibacteria bacterium CG_4_9_14_3_um_filter_40_16]
MEQEKRFKYLQKLNAYVAMARGTLTTRFTSLKDNKFFVIIFGFVLGVLLSSFLNFSINTTVFLIFVVVVLILYLFVAIKDENLKSQLILIPLIIFAVSLGILRFQIKDHHTPSSLNELVGGKALIEGLIVKEPESEESYTQLIVEIEKINSNEFYNTGEKILVRADLYPKAVYGDRIKAEGRVDEPKTFLTDAGREFDYKKYLSKDDIRFILSFAKIEILAQGEGNKTKEALFGFKNKIIDNFNRNISEPESGLLGGIVLGVKGALGKDLEEKLRQTSIIHIVVLSGYNITIVAQFMMGLLFFIPRRRALWASIIGIALFAIMVGAEPSVIRASLMGVLALLANVLHRRYDITRALVFAGFLMIVWNPKILVFDFGFQLSFLATAALIWVAPFFEDKLNFIPKRLGLRTIVSATISTQLFVLPLLLYQTGQLSLVGVFVNLLVLPLVPLVMFFGFISGVLGFVSHTVAFPFSAISQIILFYIIKVVELFGSLPLASIKISNFPFSLMAVVYVLYGFVFWKYVKNGNDFNLNILKEKDMT